MAALDFEKFESRNYASNKSAWINAKNLTSDSMRLKFESGKKLVTNAWNCQETKRRSY